MVLCKEECLGTFRAGALGVVSSGVFFRYAFVETFSRRGGFPVGVFFVGGFPDFRCSVCSFVFVVRSSCVWRLLLLLFWLPFFGVREGDGEVTCYCGVLDSLCVYVVAWQLSGVE